MKCWCGAVGTYKELFDDSGLEEVCGGFGILNCFCGGASAITTAKRRAAVAKTVTGVILATNSTDFLIDLVRDHEADDRRS